MESRKGKMLLIMGVLTLILTVSGATYAYFNGLSGHIMNLHTTDGANGLYLHDGEGTYADYEAGDNSYRYSGANPSNYVCFGYDDETKAYANNWCPENNLYRIIGVFDGKAKLIKKTPSKTSMAWDTKGEYGSNNWCTSDMKTYLNGEYLTSIGSFDDKIAEAIWKVSGNTETKIRLTIGVKNVYDAEIRNPDVTNRTDGIIEDTFKVGLMYVSDYMYAADPKEKDAWSALMGYNSDDLTKNFKAVTDHNWMYLGTGEWTITPFSSAVSYVFSVFASGALNCNRANNGYAARPSFYVNASVTYGGGEGTSANPYRIA